MIENLSILLLSIAIASITGLFAYGLYILSEKSKTVNKIFEKIIDKMLEK